VAILTSDQRPVGSVAISMPASRFDPDDLPRQAALMVDAAREIAAGLPQR